MVANHLLKLRRNLANAEFLQRHIYTLNESRFVDSTYNYWIRLCRETTLSAGPELFPNDVVQDSRDELTRQLQRRLYDRMPPIYSSLIKLSSKITPENSVRECLAQSAQRVAEELPVCAQYAICFSQLNRLIRAYDPANALPPNDEEFTALFDHHSRHTLKQARARFPKLWDEVHGHYVLDTRGAVFATALVTGLRDRGYLHDGSRFLDVGSGTGTMVAAVQRHTAAHATGIEKHAGVMRMAKSMLRRLQRAQSLTQTSREHDAVKNKSVNLTSSDGIRRSESQIELIVGDCFESASLDLSRYDVIYVYSPIRKWEIDVDRVIDHMQMGAILATSKSPQRNRRFVERLDPVAELSCFRKIKEVSDPVVRWDVAPR